MSVVCVCTVYMLITYLGTDSKPAYFLGIISEECRSLGMDKKPSGVPVGCSLVVVLVRWNILTLCFLTVDMFGRVDMRPEFHIASEATGS